MSIISYKHTFLSANLHISINSYDKNVENINVPLIIFTLFKQVNDLKKVKMFEQISFNDIKLRIGDKLYKDGRLYAEVMGESKELYFLHKSGSSCDMPNPYFKKTIIENILFGKLFLEEMHFQ